VAGRGLQGDRYFDRSGTFSSKPGDGRQITLIEAEALEAILRESDIALPPQQSRRNILTRGVALNHLVGREFRIGSVNCMGVRLCEPCGHLEKLTRQGVRAALIHRGGLRADILTDGVICVGDVIVT
ncbi:MAG: MOSC domain-containing protein, partial [Tepidisphaeraceae bacterium]